PRAHVHRGGPPRHGRAQAAFAGADERHIAASPDRKPRCPQGFRAGQPSIGRRCARPRHRARGDHRWTPRLPPDGRGERDLGARGSDAAALHGRAIYLRHPPLLAPDGRGQSLPRDALGVRARPGLPALQRPRRSRGRAHGCRIRPRRGPPGLRPGRAAHPVGDPARLRARGRHVIEATLYSDPACPWAYSESPALRVIDWRYGDQLRWRLVMIGLTDDASQYEARGYTPLRGALGQMFFRRRYGMPFSPAPKARLSATGRACRAVIAARIDQPGSERLGFRALQLANFTTPLILDDDQQLAEVVSSIPGIDATSIVARIDDHDVVDAYEQDKLESRGAAGSAAELQGKTRATDGPVRFTAPSLSFERDGLRVAGR